MNTNPFTLSFSKKSLQYISRLTETNQIYMITGVRGSGKKVMMTGIASELRKRDDCGHCRRINFPDQRPSLRLSGSRLSLLGKSWQEDLRADFT